ncbi:syntaxin-16-like [Pollicipes pollicipes]|uniref:syntaxin-16-like n=1 Tax=Pollicipes pollicipes TaxID=41117 RepID=UPI001884F1DC|nr:syntaxin-16-like [Pollicipes pollicipes]
MVGAAAMASRSLTDVFLLMRNNAQQTRHMYSAHGTSDSEALVAREVQFAARDVQERLHELDALRQRHLTRPTLDDSTADEQQIEALQHDITAALVVLALATRLQELSGEFRSSQGQYLRRHQQREQRSQSYFDAMMLEESVPPDAGEEDRAFMQHGELVRSITELNVIFRDLASMVAGQAQLVDRIDVNVDNTQVKVTQGLRQLQKADQYQRRGRKMSCIFGLAGLIVLLLIILISVKS